MAKRSAGDTEKTRLRILAAAERVFARVGFEGASLSAIADEAAVPKSLVSHHFGKKQKLWDTVRLRSFSHFVDQQLATLSAGASGFEFVRQGCTAYFRFLEQNPAFLRMLYWNQAERGTSFSHERDAVTHASAQRLVAESAERVRELQARGELRKDLDPRLVVAAFLGLLRQWFVVRADYFTTDEQARRLDDAYLATVIALFWDGVRPPASR